MILVFVRALALAGHGRHELVLENLALRQQLHALRREPVRSCGDETGCFGSSWPRRGDTGAQRSCRSNLPRQPQATTAGDVVAFPEVGGLHHRDERRAA